ncbi:MAG TPA: acyclic terpene utilization AtuA family protein [Candidatus Dormibacteraeota bacterium]|jgi:hypothetical protein|nr:acyclic terpene utilization AtuA family protein [Candidatus Dormibacteraeota bacterium]
MPGPQVSVGCGSAYAEDRIEPAVALAETGLVDYMAFDCLAERTLALAQIRRLADSKQGQDRRIPAFMDGLAPFIKRGGKVTANWGAANIDAALDDVLAGLKRAGISGTRIGVIRGDDVRDMVVARDLELGEIGETARSMGDRLISANAYIGGDSIVDMLGEGAQIVFGGRIADPSLFVAPICYEMDWDIRRDWDRVGYATMVGHLLECGIHGAGGNFEDPPYRTVPNPHDLANPYGVVSEESSEISKTPGSGGAMNAMITKTQLAYEIHDPAHYLTPDVTADFTQVTVEEIGENRVRVRGATGSARPATLKVLCGVDLGWKAVGEISYGGPGCVERARRGEEILRKRIEKFAADITELRVDFHGVSALFGDRMPGGYPADVRMRMAARCTSREVAEKLVHEVEWMYFGPAGGGGVSFSVVPAIGVTPAFLPREDLRITAEVVTA